MEKFAGEKIILMKELYCGTQQPRNSSRRLIDDDPFLEIYSSRSNSWRKLVGVDLPRPLSIASGGRVNLDGMCHWWGVDGNVTHTLYFLSSFDLSNEEFFITPIPLDIDILSDIDDFDSDLVKMHLVVFNGSIALISWYLDMTTFHISILGEVGVKESWTKLFIIGPLPCIEHPIGVGKKGDIFFKRTDGELVLFDLSTQMIEELDLEGDSHSHVVMPYGTGCKTLLSNFEAGQNYKMEHHRRGTFM